MPKFDRFGACSIRDFSEVQELYRSSSGAVYRARFNYDSKTYVLKERILSELGKRKDIANEVQLLSQLAHVNVIRCEGWFWDSIKNSLFIVLEYCECGDLHKLIEKRKAKSRYFEEKYIWHIFYHICLGVRHLHENGIVHRDLKSLNIMLTRNYSTAKIADLGVSRQVSEDTIMLQTFYGTPLYLSPELIDNAQYNEKTDIWSLGVILYELSALRTPFRSRTLLGLAKSIKIGAFEPLPSKFSPYLEKCVRWLLQLDLTKRPNINQIIRWVERRLTEGYKGIEREIVEDIGAEGDETDESGDEGEDGGPDPVRRLSPQMTAAPERRVDLASGRLESSNPCHGSSKEFSAMLDSPRRPLFGSDKIKGSPLNNNRKIISPPKTVTSSRSRKEEEESDNDKGKNVIKKKQPKILVENGLVTPSKERDRENRAVEFSPTKAQSPFSASKARARQEEEKPMPSPRSPMLDHEVDEAKPQYIAPKVTENDVAKNSIKPVSKNVVKNVVEEDAPMIEIDKQRVYAILRRETTLLRRLTKTRGVMETDPSSHGDNSKEFIVEPDSPRRRALFNSRGDARQVVDSRIKICQQNRLLLEAALESGMCDAKNASLLKIMKQVSSQTLPTQLNKTTSGTQFPLDKRPQTANNARQLDFPPHKQLARVNDGVGQIRELKFDAFKLPSDDEKKVQHSKYARPLRHSVFGLNRLDIDGDKANAPSEGNQLKGIMSAPDAINVEKIKRPMSASSALRSGRRGYAPKNTEDVLGRGAIAQIAPRVLNIKRSNF